MEQVKQHAEVLNLPEKMINQLITQTEEKIFNMRLRMEEIEPDIKEWERKIEAEYRPLKESYTEMEETVLEDEKMLNVLVGFKTNPNSNKKIKVLRSVSNGETRKIKRPRKHNWLDLGIAILKQQNFFMSPENLINKIFLKHPEVKGSGAATKQNDETIKQKIAGNFKRSATLPNHKRIVLFNGRLGLPEWVDEGGIVKPEHLIKSLKAS